MNKIILTVLVLLIVPLYISTFGFSIKKNTTPTKKVEKVENTDTLIINTENALDIIIAQKEEEIRKSIEEQEAKVKEIEKKLEKKRKNYLLNGGTVEEWQIMLKIMCYQEEMKKTTVDFNIKIDLIKNNLIKQDSILSSMVEKRFNKELIEAKKVQLGLKDTTIIRENDTIKITKKDTI